MWPFLMLLGLFAFVGVAIWVCRSFTEQTVANVKKRNWMDIGFMAALIVAVLLEAYTDSSIPGLLIFASALIYFIVMLLKQKKWFDLTLLFVFVAGIAAFYITQIKWILIPTYIIFAILFVRTIIFDKRRPKNKST